MKTLIQNYFFKKTSLFMTIGWTSIVKYISTIAQSLVEISKSLQVIKDIMGIQANNHFKTGSQLGLVGMSPLLVITPLNIDKSRKAIWLTVYIDQNVPYSNKPILFAISVIPSAKLVDSMCESDLAIAKNKYSILVKLEDVEEFINRIYLLDYVRKNEFVYKDLRNIKLELLKNNT